MRENNPFSIIFGKTPNLCISRNVIRDEIINAFNSKVSPEQAFIITGIRGTGKTALMNEIKGIFNEFSDWIIINLNSNRNILEDLALELRDEKNVSNLIKKLDIDISLFEIVSIGTATRKENVVGFLRETIKAIKRDNRRLLILIDEIRNEAGTRAFISEFQKWVGDDLPVYLLVTALPEKIESLKNADGLTFLYRASKVTTGNLNLIEVKNVYKEVFETREEEAKKMATLTKGYPYGFQLLGYIKWNNPNLKLSELMKDYDESLADKVYDKIWSELANSYRAIIEEIELNNNNQASSIQNKLNMSSQTYNTIKNRMIKKGLIVVSKRGAIETTLPRLGEYIKNFVY